MTTRLWDRAGARSIAPHRRLTAALELAPEAAPQAAPGTAPELAAATVFLPEPEVPALPPDRLPSIPELFDFMRDAELRFRTLRLEIEETARTAAGEETMTTELLLRHPGDARVTRRIPGPGPVPAVEIWCSDGKTVRTYASRDRRGAIRPLRRGLVGLDDPDLPGMSRVYVPLTPLPAESLPELFVHPAGYCQNILATGACAILGIDEVAGREAILLGCAHPRTIEWVGDRPDFRIDLAVDVATGLITRLVETISGKWTRWAEVVRLEPDAIIPPTPFDLAFPDGTTLIY